MSKKTFYQWIRYQVNRDDMAGEKIDGVHANMYILKKNNYGIKSVQLV